MNICFYAPFKPLGHPNPSGDLIIATGLYGYFENRGHKVRPASDLRARWIYWKPWLWPKVLKELRRIMRTTGRDQPELWLTYHTYYKAPDLIGPTVCRARGLPYVQLESTRATSRLTGPWAGFAQSAHDACNAARVIFYHTANDLITLERERFGDQALVHLSPFLPTSDLPPASNCGLPP